MVPCYHIYTDGSCISNPGPGGYAATITKYVGANKIEMKKFVIGNEIQTTNNRMELMAVVSSLESLEPSSFCNIWVDSLYVKDGITNWIKEWKKNGWKTSKRTDVKNKDLWQRLDKIVTTMDVVHWKWTRAHNGDTQNEEVDRLAKKQAIIAQQNKDEKEKKKEEMEPEAKKRKIVLSD